MFICIKIPGKKPISSRFFATLCTSLLVLTWASRSLAQERAPRLLSDDEVIHLVHEREDRASMRGARVREIEANARIIGALPNPGFSYTREQILTASQRTGEDYFVLNQTFPISGRAKLEKNALEKGAMAERLRIEQELREDVVRARHYFYQLLLLQSRVEARESWLVDISKLEQTIQLRIEVGESAPYELERLKREVADVRLDLELERTKISHLQMLLANELGLTGANAITARGTLLPSSPPTEQDILTALEQHPELRAAKTEAEAARIEQEAAERWWIPEPTVSAGYKGSGSSSGRAHGFVVGLGMAFPLFNRSAGERLAAEAREVHATNQEQIQAKDLRARALALSSQLSTTLAHAERYEEEGIGNAQKVLDLANIAYKSGEIGIIELLDAYQGVAQAKLRLLELSSSARTLQIQLHQYLGGKAQ